MQRHNRPRGFTLIELMIVVGIVAILMAVMLPSYLQARAQGNYSSCKQNLTSFAKSFEMYAADNIGQFPTNPANLIPAYIRTVPTCPSSSRRYTVVTAPAPDSAYTLYCPGINHATVGIQMDYPEYSGTQGLIEH